MGAHARVCMCKRLYACLARKASCLFEGLRVKVCARISMHPSQGLQVPGVIKENKYA